jgi:hypothetical protein
VLDHGRESEDRKRQEKAGPEPLSEIRHHLTVIVPGIAVMSRMRGVIVRVVRVPGHYHILKARHMGRQRENDMTRRVQEFERFRAQRRSFATVDLAVREIAPQ